MEYHKFRHATDTFLALARLIHGGILDGIRISGKGAFLALVGALFHDCGYILAKDETGPGAKYTLTHLQRSVDFIRKYFLKNGYPRKDRKENIHWITAIVPRYPICNP